jgi:putative tricarboxylic transport membrane protein
MERATAAAVAFFGIIVAGESLTHEIGWTENGPGTGYFPFRVGLLLVGAALVLLLPRRQPQPDVLFASADEMRRSLSVFWPTLALVIGILTLGAYVPSAVYLAWMMRRHGGYAWTTALASGAAVMATFFLIFDVWFRVPLAKGPIEAALGIY